MTTPQLPFDVNDGQPPASSTPPTTGAVKDVVSGLVSGAIGALKKGADAVYSVVDPMIMSIGKIAVVDPVSPHADIANLPNADRDSTAASAGLIGQGDGPSGSKGNFNVYRYPEELGNAENPHYVMFFVNTPEARIGVDTASTQVRAKYDPTKNNPDRINFQTPGVIQNAGQLEGEAFGLLKASEAAKDLAQGNLGKALGDTGGALFSTAAFGTLGRAIGDLLEGSVASSKLVQLKDCIAINIQTKPTTEYNASWEEEDLGALGSLSQNPNLGDAKAFLLREALLKGSMIPRMVGLGFDFRSFIQKQEQRVPNPHKEQLFRSMGMRKFSFSYTFMPKSQNEYDNVKQIIFLFRKYMHPAVAPSKYYLIYPAEFNIIHYYQDKENTNLHKIASCALIDMKVEYGSEDFLTFKDTDGAPTEIAVTLTFQELEMLTSQRVEQGF